jgi:hypothetical protein
MHIPLTEEIRRDPQLLKFSCRQHEALPSRLLPARREIVLRYWSEFLPRLRRIILLKFAAE